VARIGVITAVAAADSRFLPTLVDSLRAQTLTDWQLVIAEDGPTESARSWADVDPRISWLNSDLRTGPAEARNRAVARLDADLLRNLDADDWLADAGVLERTVEVFTHESVAYAVGPVVDVLDDARVPFADLLPAGPIEPGVLYRGWLARGHRGLAHPTSLAMRTDVFRRYNGYPPLPSSEDTALLLQVSQHEPGWYLDRPVTFYRRRPDSITASAWHNDAAATAARVALIRALCDPVA
jgi:glycosyltransferase involved in cell wall biosynthesis